MATIEELCSRGDLERVRGVLEIHEVPVRSIYLLPKAANWMRKNLPSLEPDGFVDGAIRPNQQTYQLMKDFIRGADLFSDDWFPKPLMPRDNAHGIWELRTPDLRFFGWFVRRGVLIVASVETKVRLVQHKLYDGHREQAVVMRDNLDLDEPKFLNGEQSDVF